MEFLKILKNIILFILGVFLLLGAIAMVSEDILATIFFGSIAILCFFLSKEFFKNFSNFIEKYTSYRKNMLDNISNAKKKYSLKLKDTISFNYITQTKNNIKKTQINSLSTYPNNQLNKDWYISISFGKSSSENFTQAVSLAKMSPKYIENNIDGQIIYQAIFSSEPNEFLLFVKLYELVSQWKSCFVMINNQMMDRKVIQKLNYCYGDKCRSNNSNFCFGASYMTDNPFGCHRLQISAANHPMHNFYKNIGYGKYKLNKEDLINRINEKSKPYLCCPDFNKEYILKVLDSLPLIITKKEYDKLLKSNTYLQNI